MVGHIQNMEMNVKFHEALVNFLIRQSALYCKCLNPEGMATSSRKATSLRVHGKPSIVGFMLYDLLKEAGYDDEETQDVASALTESAEVVF